MRWGEVTHEMNRVKVKVWTPDTGHEHLLNDIYIGRVDCHKPDLPVMLRLNTSGFSQVTGELVRRLRIHIPDWWYVEKIPTGRNEN